MSLERRLNNLEARASGTKWEIPLEVRIHLKAVDRHRARERGEQPPAYSPEEIEHMHSEDLAEAAGGGMLGKLRDDAGWTTAESLEILERWEEAARRRLERVEAGESLSAVYNDDEELQDE